MNSPPYDHSAPPELGAGQSSPGPEAVGGSPPHWETRYRRRRVGAGVAVTALAALIVAIISGGGAASRRVVHSVRRPPTPAPGGLPGDTLAGLGNWTPQQLAAVDRVLRYAPYVTQGSHRRREVALTFDDGPSTFTPQVLTILRHEHAPATFFQIGRSATQYPDIAREVLAAGLPIGDHTETHPALAGLSSAQQRTEILDGAKAIQSYGAPYPRLFRPPYGSFNATTEKLARGHRMLTIMWTVDTRDFSQPGVRNIISTAVSGAKPGAIILMHDGGGPRSETVAALPHIIRDLRRRRFRLVTVPQLVLDDPPQRTQSAPLSSAG